MKRIGALVFFFLITSFWFPVRAAVPYQNGMYTNLCGTGTTASEDTCNKGCDPALGTCTSTGTNVVKFICDGNLTNCRNNISDFAKSQTVADATCGKTVEIDVYTKKCQTVFGWFCSETDRTDYMVWYSGNCSGTAATPPTPTITPAPTTTCNSLTITNGNSGLIPATLAFQMNSSGPAPLYRVYFGDGAFTETTTTAVSHRYDVSGIFTARVFVRDASGHWVTSPSCKTAASVAGIPLETQKSECANLFITRGNYVKAPTTVTFEVTGYDNKGLLNQYKMDFGDGQTQTSGTNTFSYQYTKPGTYTARGYILDSQNRWLTDNARCVQSVYAATDTLTSQPDTGTPTWYTILALSSGILGASILLSVFYTRQS